MKTTTLLLLIVVIAATGCNMQKRNRRDSSEEVLPRVSTASERTLPPPSIQTRDNLDLLEESEETSVSESLPTIQKDKETFF